MPNSPVSTSPDRSLIRSLAIGLSVLLLLYAFISAINVMSSGLKTLARCPATAPYLHRSFASAGNPIAGLFVGILVTSLFQSSSFTTSLTVGLVASGQLSVAAAVPIVMGANVGTSVTNTLVSLGHVAARLEFRRAFAAAIVHDIFNLLTLAILLPLELQTRLLTRLASALAVGFAPPIEAAPRSPLKLATRPVVRAIHLFLEKHLHLPPEWVGGLAAAIGLVGLLVALILLVRAMKRLVLARLEAFFARYFFRNWVLAVALGLATTVLVQSSSVTTSLIVPLVGAGALRLRQVFPYTVGANIGTTVTAIIAGAATGSAAGLAIAFAHLFFNLIGATIFIPLRALPIALASSYARLVIRARWLAAVYILALFFLLPLLGIILAG